MWQAFRDRDFANRMRCRAMGLRSVEFWRHRGFENLVRAREIKAAKRARAMELVDLERRQAQLQGNIENLRPWWSS
jgi:hypothetical protein